MADGTVGFPNELRHDVQVANRSEELGNIAEFLVDVHLLQVSLRQPFGVASVLILGSVEQNIAPTSYPFPLNDGSSKIVLRKAKFVDPGVGNFFIPDGHADDKLRVTASSQAADA